MCFRIILKFLRPIPISLKFSIFLLNSSMFKIQCHMITAVPTACHFARFTPDSDFFHHTFFTVYTVHSVWSAFTLVVIPLLNTIAYYIFSSVLAEPQCLPRAVWDLLDFAAAETLHLLSLVEFTGLLNGCSPDALLRNAFVILRMVARPATSTLRPSDSKWKRRSGCEERPQLSMPAAN